MSTTEPVELASQQLDESLREAVAPVVEQVERLDAVIAKREAELASLRETRKRAQRVLFALDPQRKPPKGESTSGQRAGALARAERENAEKLQRVRAYVTRNGNGEIGVSDLTAAPELAGIGRGKLTELLARLADEGTLRLDRIGSGGAKIYRLVSP
jgi:hypothetical protein